MDYFDSKIVRAGEVVQSFLAVSRILVRLSSQNAADLNLTLQQMGILNVISTSPKTTLIEISGKLDLPKSTVSMTVDSLVNAGLVERKINENDRREIQLTATPKGKALTKKSSANAPSYRAMALALEKMPEEDVKALIRIQKDLLNDLRNFYF